MPVPPSTDSPTDADVVTVVPGEVISSSWGVSVANDLAELWAEKADQAALDGHVTAPLGSHEATAIAFVPTGTVTATDVQAAIEQASTFAGMPGPPGADGAVGPQGEKGDPGEPGGSILSAFWTWATSTAAPPSGGQLRSDATLTTLWVNEIDTDGFNRAAGLATITADSTILLRSSNGTVADLDVTGTPTDNGTYWTIPVAVIGTPTITKGARTQISIVSPTPVGLPAGGSTGQMLAKTSSTDYATGWTDAGPASTTVDYIVTLTQAAYDAIVTKDASTLYFIT